MFKVLLTDNPDPVCLDLFERYEQIHAEITGTHSEAELRSLISPFHAVIVRSPTRMTADVISGGRSLRFIGRAGTGCDNIDIDAATRNGIVVMNAPTANIISTAEHTLGLILSLVRRIPHAHNSVTAGEWIRSKFRGRELYGKTAGIVGLGRVGTEVARRLQAFSMRVIATDPAIGEKTRAGVDLVDLDTLLGASDIISIHTPLTSKTRGLIGAREIGKMRDGVYIVNCARGGIVEEAALRTAIDAGTVAGVAMDVYEREPPGGSPLLGHRASVFTPHIGAATEEARRRVMTEIAENIAEALVNGVMRSVVNPEASK